MTQPPVAGFLTISPEAASHVAAALGKHREEWRRMGLAVPREVVQLHEAFAIVATSGQARPTFDQVAELSEAAAVTRGLLTTEQTAQALGVSPRTVRRLAAAGELPRVRIGGSVRFRSSDIDGHLEGLAQEGGQRRGA